MGSVTSRSTEQTNEPHVASPPRWFVWSVRIFGSLGVLSAVLRISTGDPLAGLLQLTWVIGGSMLMMDVVPPGRLLSQIERHSEPLLILVIATLAGHAVVEGIRGDWLIVGLLITTAVVAIYRYGTVRCRMSAYAEIQPIFADIDAAFDQMSAAVERSTGAVNRLSVVRDELASALSVLQEKLANPRSRNRRPGRPEKLTAEEIIAAVKRFRHNNYGETPSQEEIAAELGVHPNTVQNCLRRAGTTWTAIIS